MFETALKQERRMDCITENKLENKEKKKQNKESDRKEELLSAEFQQVGIL